MRQIIAGFFQSIDGVVQSPGASTEDERDGFTKGGWVFPHFDAEVAAFMGEIFAGPFDLLLGRRTYDIFAGHWPQVAGDEMADRINGAVKFVLTNRAAGANWPETRTLADFDAVETAKRSEGPDLLIQGSTTLYPELLRRRLIDRLFVLTFPIVLGSGRRLFGDAPALGLTLVDHRVSQSGVAIAVYEKPDDLKTAPVPFETTTDAEEARS